MSEGEMAGRVLQAQSSSSSDVEAAVAVAEAGRKGRGGSSDWELGLGRGDPRAPEQRANFLSKLVFWWYNDAIALGFRRYRQGKSLEHSDLWPLAKHNLAANAHRKFEERWRHYRRKHGDKPTILIRTLVSTHWHIVFLGMFLYLVQQGLLFAGPIMLNNIVKYVASRGRSTSATNAYLFAAGLLLFPLLGTIMAQLQIRVRGQLVSAIYRKALRLSTTARQAIDTGRIVNLQAVDTQQIVMFINPFLTMLFSAPIVIVAAIILLFFQLGWPTFAGVAIMVLITPTQSWLVKKLAQLRRRQLVHMDERVKLTNEMLAGIRVIKLYAWEEPLIDTALEARSKEIGCLRKSAYVRACVAGVLFVLPVFVAVASFAMYAAVAKNEVTPATAFTAIALFGILRFPLAFLPFSFTQAIQAWVALKRLSKFLTAAEVQPRTAGKGLLGISVSNGNFKWTDAEEAPLVLKDVNVELPLGKLTAVIGPVASGKSSFLSALLGDMIPASSEATATIDVAENQRVAYVAQQAWIINATLRENVLMGEEFNSEKYEAVIDACALRDDIKVMPAGDMTEIGEKGINISGGQKQRVSVARALYSNAQVILLDDPLSAVDAHVGKHIFDEVIIKRMRKAGKTIILATNQVQFLHAVDHVVVLSDGSVAEQGKYQELIARKGVMADLVRDYGGHDGSSTPLPSPAGNKPDENALLGHKVSNGHVPQAVTDTKATVTEQEHTGSGSPTEGKAANKKRMSLGMLVRSEGRQQGKVSSRAYVTYIKHCGGAFFLVVLVVSLAAEQATRIGTDLWLSYWSSGKLTPVLSLGAILGLYMGWATSNAVVVFFRSLQIALGGLRAAKTLQERLMNTVMRLPLVFFDTNPLGRILNRFSKDTDDVDYTLSQNWQQVLNCLGRLVGTGILLAVIFPLMLAIMAPVVVAYYLVEKLYVMTSREMQRLDAVSRSPIYATFSEALSGTTTIRAYGYGDRLMQNNSSMLDRNHQAFYGYQSGSQWLQFRLEVLGTIIVFGAGMLSVAQKDKFASNAGLIGLALSEALDITSFLKQLVRMAAEVESKMNAVERVVDYIEQKTEPPFSLPSTDPKPGSWPSKGGIQISDLVLRYRPELEPALRGMSVKIEPGNKVGVVGRTGAGKSSLMLALFRLVEAEAGQLIVDDCDIQKLGLTALRSSISIIPQDPVIFSGTLRSNLDPFNQHTDMEIWEAVEDAGLKTIATADDKGLEMPIKEGGDNLSVGTRQLVLVMDEATASVDVETDAAIQRCVREKFKDSTVLTIAHRLNTVMDADKILVLSFGKVVEYDSPARLLADENSMLSKMAADTGAMNAAHLRRIAEHTASIDSKATKWEWKIAGSVAQVAGLLQRTRSRRSSQSSNPDDGDIPLDTAFIRGAAPAAATDNLDSVDALTLLRAVSSTDDAHDLTSPSLHVNTLPEAHHRSSIQDGSVDYINHHASTDASNPSRVVDMDPIDPHSTVPHARQLPDSVGEPARAHDTVVVPDDAPSSSSEAGQRLGGGGRSEIELAAEVKALASEYDEVAVTATPNPDAVVWHNAAYDVEDSPFSTPVYTARNTPINSTQSTPRAGH
eukprot:jgi/Chlat1/7354/Chrsp59S06974